MFDVGWSEMLVIAVVMIVVVGPKDLPRMLRTFGKFTAKARSMAGDFQRQFNEAMREAELDEVRKSVEDLRSLNPANEIRKQFDPLTKAAAEVRSGVESLKSVETTVAKPAEPLKGGATEAPGVPPPQPEVPPSPAFPADPDAPPPQAAAPKTAKKRAPAKRKIEDKAEPAAKPARAPRRPGTQPAAKAAAAAAPAAKAPVAKGSDAKAGVARPRSRTRKVS